MCTVCYVVNEELGWGSVQNFKGLVLYTRSGTGPLVKCNRVYRFEVTRTAVKPRKEPIGFIYILLPGWHSECDTNPVSMVLMTL